MYNYINRKKKLKLKIKHTTKITEIKYRKRYHENKRICDKIK